MCSFPGESIGLKFIPSQSELFRIFPKSVSEPMPNQPDKRFSSRLMKHGQKSIRPNSNESEPIRNQVFNLDQSE